MSLPAWGARQRDPRLMAVAEPAALVQLCLVLAAFLALMHAYVTSDFSVETVWANSHTAKPLIYKISGVWGNHEGSMLLWVLILAVFGAAVALFGNNLPATLRANVLAVQAGIAVVFLLFIIPPPNPSGIRPSPGPRSQSRPAGPALPFHPPFLYASYVGLSIASPCHRRADRRTHGYRLGAGSGQTLAAWMCLTLGIAMALVAYTSWAGVVVVLGPGRERLLHAMARRDSAAALGAGDGEARGAESLDHPARHPRFSLSLMGTLVVRHPHVSARLCRRPGAASSSPPSWSC
jgi:cytochrome c biogenesis factor